MIVGYVVSVLWRIFSMALEGGSREENLAGDSPTSYANLSTQNDDAGNYLQPVKNETDDDRSGPDKNSGALLGIPSGLLGSWPRLTVSGYFFAIERSYELTNSC